MRPLSYFVASSLDGFIARVDGGIDWLFTDADYGYTEFYASVDALVLGRATFDLAMSFPEYPYPGKQAYVFSSTRKESPRPDVRFVAEDPVGFVRRLKSEPGKKIWLVGGSRLAAPLLAAEEVDELVVSIHPVTIGRGVPLFPAREGESRWRLVSSASFPSGLAQLTYALAEGARRSP